MAVQTPYFKDVKERAWAALAKGDDIDLLERLTQMTYYVAPPEFRPKVIEKRVDEFTALRDAAGYRVSTLLPDLGSIHDDWKDNIVHKEGENDAAVPNLYRSIVRGSLLLHQVTGAAADVYRDGGIPEKMKLWIDDDDLKLPGLAGNEAAWRKALYAAAPEFIPGEHKCFLVTSVVLGGEVFSNCCFDGESVQGTAALSFLPLLMAHIEHSGLFFHFGDDLRFDVEAARLAAGVKHHGVEFTVLALGQSDIEDALLMKYTEDQVYLVLRERLLRLAVLTRRKVMFCGLIPVGSVEVQSMVNALNRRLFFNALELREEGVLFFDCVSPSPSADPGEVYDFDGSLTPSFKAATLFGISRFLALSMHNLIVPRVTFTPQLADREKYCFWNRRRAKIA